MLQYLLLGIFFLLVSYLIWATAIFTKVEVRQTTFPETKIAYVTYFGDYSQSYKQTAIVEQKIKEKYGKDWSTQPCFGLYYDKPGEVPKSEMRSVIGKLIPKDFNENITPEGIYFGVIPEAKDVIQAQYPLRSIFSIFAGIHRVYSAFNKYLVRDEPDVQRIVTGAALEIYGYEGNTTLYVLPISSVNGLWTEFPKIKND